MCQVLVVVLALSLPLGATTPAAVPPPTQIQVARRFLLAVLHGEFQAAHGMLAPEVGRALAPTQFRAAAMPLYQQGQHFGPTIDLYKLGFRLRDQQATQSFVAFTFKADTLAARPEVQLDVTFRDSTARQILSFALIPLRVAGPPTK
ncbi:hypothetical protein J0X19_04440 [Hymenobacter sp. BT186]|uniref:DUF3887 domain-containing protein n=1 Tax=Hymenobacter telluris TaxID=2816474 RepID=A0A939ETW1_9BACT|nr:hypothetical protein [Hymenobacter telluris]MBO0357181.1 hypothetical protein [Hymenobacter telluris]MBW3373207.1 hypothetical protein [Hymenobacter norwichensis]